MKRRVLQIASCVRSCVATVSICLGALYAGADVSITGNTKLQDDADYRGQGTVTIAAGVTLDLNGYNLFVDGLDGTGTITDSTPLGEELIANGDFESSTITGNGGAWEYIVANGGWKSGGYGGLTKANTPWAAGVKDVVSAYVQMHGDLWQVVNVKEAGDYVLTYSYKSRKGQGAHELNVVVGDALQTCGKTYSAADWTVNTMVLRLAAGEHTFKFVGTNGGTDTSTILDDVSLRKVPAAGELHVVVPGNQTAEVTSVGLEGTLRLVKEGAGTYLVSYKSSDGIKTRYVGGTSVREGCLKIHQRSATAADYNFLQAQQLGERGSETMVEKGASFDCGGNYDGYIYAIVLNGGTYCNTVAMSRDSGTPLRLRLTADSFVNGATDTQIGEADLAGYTLDATTAIGSLYPCGAIRNGTIISRGGRFFPRKGVDCSTADLVLEGTMSCNMDAIPFHDLKVTSTATGFGHGGNFFTVSGTYTPVTDQIWRFKLLDGSTIDLSGRTTVLPVPDANGLFFEENATVFVDFGDRQVSSSELLITWSAKPSNMEFRTIPGVDGAFRILDNGLAFVSNEENIPVVACWTGRGDVSNLADPDNWACTNKYGRVVADAIPAADSIVYLPREIPFNPAGTSFTCGEIVLAENSVLKDDCDLTGFYVPINTTLDLRGHRLFVSELKGAGTVTDSTALGKDIIVNGGFEDSTITGNDGTWGYVKNGAAVSSGWETDVANCVGLSKANTTWTADVKGTVAAFVQKLGNLWQCVTVSEAGDYLLTYSYKRRPTWSVSHDLSVLVDGTTRQIYKTTSTEPSWAVNTVVVHLEAGEHRIEFSGFVAGTDDATTVLDDVSLRKIPAAGELHVVVPSGQTAEVTSVGLEGTLKLVKEGAGTYLVSYKSTDGIKTRYVGGTSVREGSLKVREAESAATQTDYNFAKTQQLGERGAETTVERGASFDCGGNYDGYIYTLVLNGGTYSAMGSVASYGNWGTPLYLRLTADSFMKSANDRQLGETDLAGCTLDVTTPDNRSLYLRAALRNGTLIIRGGRLYPMQALDCSTANLVLDGKMSCGQGTLSFHDLKVTSATSEFGHGGNYYTVSGTYTPVTDQIHRFKLLDGATIDLSGRTTALANPDANGLFFEENATVFVDLGARKVKSSEPLVTWSAKPANVKFRAVPGTVGRFTAKDDGLYRSVGLGIIVR